MKNVVDSDILKNSEKNACAERQEGPFRIQYKWWKRSKYCEYLQEKGDVETEVGELAKHEAPEGEGEVHPGDEHDHCGEVAGGLAGVRHLAHGDQDQQVDETQDDVEYLDPVVHLVQIPDNVVLPIIFLFTTTLFSLLPQV